jgi:hypothetical protein
MTAPQPILIADTADTMYYAQPAKRAKLPVLMLLGIVTLSIGILLLMRPTLLPLLAWLLVPMIVFVWISARSRQPATSLSISAYGLEYKSPDLHIKTTWANVKAMTQTVFGPSLLLYQAAALANRRKVGASTLWAEFADREIPLYPFEVIARNEIIAHIQHYAPHVMIGICS